MTPKNRISIMDGPKGHLSNGATNLEKNIVTDISETMVRLIQPTPIKLIAKGPLYIKVDSKTQCSVVEHPKDCSYKFVTEILYTVLAPLLGAASIQKKIFWPSDYHIKSK